MQEATKKAMRIDAARICARSVFGLVTCVLASGFYGNLLPAAHAAYGPNLEDATIRQAIIQQADATIQRNNKDTRAFATRAAAYLYGGQLNAAIADLTTLIGLNDRDPHWRDLRANAEAIKGDLAAAINDENVAIQLQGDVPSFYVNRSTMYLMSNRLQEASLDSQKAINMNSRLAGAYENLAEIQYRMKNYKIVLEYTNSAITRAPAFGDAYYYRGLAYDKLGNMVQAAQDMAKAKELGYNNQPTVYKSKFDN